ncbi:MAG: Rne/Rng family ribonuclease [Bryobacterales bacterium]|nr:Rne/Rng family ribonuclease [Bryobacterales bacterium]
MTKELVISANRHETKVAVLEDDQLVEIYFQRAQEYSLAGSVHKGKVTRVLPGMQSAFVDLGLERDTFLYVSDFFEESEEYEKLPAAEEKPSRRQPAEPREAREPREPRELKAPPQAPASAEPVTAESAASTDRGGRPERVDRRDRGGDRSDHNDRGGRGGRRGRRRRGRGGRGFPESKYAQEPDQAAPAGPPEELERTDAPPSLAEPDTDDFAVLPGESLAKYSRHAGEDFSETEENPEDLAEPASGSREESAAFAGAAEEDEPAVEEISAVELAEVEEAKGEEFEESSVSEDEEEGEEEASPAVEGPEDEGEELAAAADSVSLEAIEEEESGLTDEQLDAIQLQAEAMARRESPPSETAPSGTEEPAAASSAEDEAGTAIFEPSSSGAEGSEEGPSPAEEEDETAAHEPVLASIDSMASSHREQTSRFLRGRRMRRRRQSDPNVRTVNREPAREPREARERSEGREPREREPREKEGREVSRESRPAQERQAQQPSITELLREGQEIVVQIAKEPMGQKGARITSHIALPGRYCVYMPTVEHLGVSRKIASDEERQRLRRILQTHRQGIPGGFIIRTAGEGKTEEQIASDLQYLYQLWTEIKQKSERLKAPALLYHDVEIVQRLLRDQLTDQFKNIWVDNEDLYETVVRFVQRMQPGMVNKVKLYTRSAPIFDAFNITSELEKALRPKVWLKSGGYIVINQTEALVAIDVNTGKYVGKSHRLEDTIVKTNTDAVKEIVRQVRLRDLGGIIVVDFIDMDERKNRQKVMQALEEAMRSDRAPNKILQFNDFGLVAITRKRVKQSLERTLCAPCAACEGSGYTKSVQTVISEILAEALKLAPHVETKEVMLRVHPAVAIALKSKDNDYLEELEETFKRPVLVTGDEALHPEKFDLG